LNTNSRTKHKTFAQVLKQDNSKVINNRKPSHVITIYTKDQNMTSDDIKKDIKTKLNPMDLKVDLNKTKNISKNGLIIECDSKVIAKY
jgi:putative NIF3 family GTP cyclohydrolase 1 type 2